MKVKYPTDNICAFGGLKFTDKLLKDQGIFTASDNSLNDKVLLV